MKNLQDLLYGQLQKIYSAENQLLHTLPDMLNRAKNHHLKKLFERRIENTYIHQKRLEAIFLEFDWIPGKETCKALEGILTGVHLFLARNAANPVKDAGLIVHAQIIAHYKIAGYLTASNYATHLNMITVSESLQKNLYDELSTNEKLKSLAKFDLHKKATKTEPS